MSDIDSHLWDFVKAHGDVIVGETKQLVDSGVLSPVDEAITWRGEEKHALLPFQTILSVISKTLHSFTMGTSLLLTFTCPKQL